MAIVRRKINFRWLYKRIFWVISFFVFLLGMLRWGKGAGVLDFYAFLIRPFGPGTAQREWIIQGVQLEQNIRLKLLEDDNRRLREILALKNISSPDRISAAVIARSTNGCHVTWWPLEGS